MALYNLARLLLSAIANIGVRAATLYPLDMWLPELRSDIVGATYRTRAAVQSMARDCRFKIMALLALISFTIATQTTPEDRRQATPCWYTAETSSRPETSQEPDRKAPANDAGPPAVDAGRPQSASGSTGTVQSGWKI